MGNDPWPAPQGRHSTRALPELTPRAQPTFVGLLACLFVLSSGVAVGCSLVCRTGPLSGDLDLMDEIWGLLPTSGKMTANRGDSDESEGEPGSAGIVLGCVASLRSGRGIGLLGKLGHCVGPLLRKSGQRR
jgi:hypothetical protein